MKTTAAAFFPADVVDQIGDAFDVVDAAKHQLRVRDVARHDRDRADSDHALKQVLLEGHVVHVDDFNTVGRLRQDAGFVDKPLSGQLVLDAEAAVKQQPPPYLS